MERKVVPMENAPAEPADAGMSAPWIWQDLVLATLAEHTEWIRESALAGETGLPEESLRLLLLKLEAEGAAERREDPVAPPAKLVRLTAEGRDRDAAAAVNRQRELARLFSALSRGERQDLTDQLRPFRGGENGGR